MLIAVFFLRYLLTSIWVYRWNAVPTDVLAAPQGRRGRAPRLQGGARLQPGPVW